MTQKTTQPPVEAQAFENAVAAVLLAHHRHAAVLIEGRSQDAPRSRRALYNALKDYRSAETKLFHVSTNEKHSQSNSDDESETHRK